MFDNYQSKSNGRLPKNRGLVEPVRSRSAGRKHLRQPGPGQFPPVPRAVQRSADKPERSADKPGARRHSPPPQPHRKPGFSAVERNRAHLQAPYAVLTSGPGQLLRHGVAEVLKKRLPRLLSRTLDALQDPRTDTAALSTRKMPLIRRFST